MIILNAVTKQVSKCPFHYLRVASNLQQMIKSVKYSTVVDNIDIFTSDLIQKNKVNPWSNECNVRHIMDIETKVSSMNAEELNEMLLNLLSKNKDKKLQKIVMDCLNSRKFIDEQTLKKMFRNYSVAGKIDMVEVLQKYCSKVDPNLYKRNGEFLHYLAKAQCFRGNSEKGLNILMNSYKKYEGLRCFYRIIFRELIQDTVLNRSEASLVVCKKYVLLFSETWADHYPLVCFWHICWCSTWFSDQMLSNELLEGSKALQEIVREKATAFSLNILKEEYNEDAVMRLLQMLLKYELMLEYAKVLQILFNYKLRQGDIRGCTEIIRNCETLGIVLPSDQQGRYIRLLINRQINKPETKVFKDFKLKF